MVLKELIYKSCYIGRVWWSSKNRFLPFSNLGGCGGLERTDFFTVSNLGGCGGLEVSMLGGCGGLERTDFITVSNLGVCGCLERTHFNFLCWEGCWS